MTREQIKSSEPIGAVAPTSAAGGIELAPGVFVSEHEIRFQFARSGGPGGQNVNKLNTKAELWVQVDAITGLSPGAMDRLRQFAGKRLTASGEIHFSGETERGQEGNRQAVLDRLRDLIEKARMEPRPRKRSGPSRRARAKRLEQKKHRAQVKASRRTPAGNHE